MGRLMREESGFTLVELLTAMIVFAVVLATFSMVLSSAIRHSGDIEEQGNLRVEARSAINTIASDVRQVYDGDGNTTTSPILYMSGTELRMYAPDRLQPFHMRRVTYRLNGGKLERAFLTSSDTDGYPWVGVSSNPTAFRTVVANVTNTPVFAYLQADGTTAATTPAQVATVVVTLKVKTTTGSESTYTSKVTLRGEA